MEKEIAKRLLHLYPIKVIQSYFNLKDTQNVLLDSLSVNKSDAELIKFAENAFEYTKKHVYVFSHKINVSIR